MERLSGISEPMSTMNLPTTLSSKLPKRGNTLGQNNILRWSQGCLAFRRKPNCPNTTSLKKKGVDELPCDLDQFYSAILGSILKLRYASDRRLAIQTLAMVSVQQQSPFARRLLPFHYSFLDDYEDKGWSERASRSLGYHGILRPTQLKPLAQIRIA